MRLRRRPDVGSAPATANAPPTVDLVQKIVDCAGSEEEIDIWLNELQSRVPHPAVTDLIYHNETSLAVDEIVDAALAIAVYGLPSP